MFTYIITGMGRSGTSFLAECLYNNKVKIGDKFYMGKNPYGGYENKELVNLNRDTFLKAGMKEWITSKPTDQEALSKAFQKNKEKYRKFIQDNKDNMWGIKDPRLSLIAKDFTELILEEDNDPFIYLCFRRPSKVADDICKLKDKRGQEKNREEYIKIAQVYNQRLIEFLEWFNTL